MVLLMVALLGPAYPTYMLYHPMHVLSSFRTLHPSISRSVPLECILGCVVLLMPIVDL